MTTVKIREEQVVQVVRDAVEESMRALVDDETEAMLQRAVAEFRSRLESMLRRYCTEVEVRMKTDPRFHKAGIDVDVTLKIKQDPDPGRPR